MPPLHDNTHDNITMLLSRHYNALPAAALTIAGCIEVCYREAIHKYKTYEEYSLEPLCADAIHRTLVDRMCEGGEAWASVYAPRNILLGEHGQLDAIIVSVLKTAVGLGQGSKKDLAALEKTLFR